MIKRLWPSRLGPQLALLTVGLLVAVQMVSVAIFALMLPRSVPAFEPKWLVERLTHLADGAIAQPPEARPAWLAAQSEARWFSFHFDESPELMVVPPEARVSAWLTTLVAEKTTFPWARIDVSTGRPRAVGPIAPPRLERIPPQSTEEPPMPPAIVFFVATFVAPDGSVLAVRPFMPGRSQSAAIVLAAWLITFLVAASLVGWWAIARIAAPLGLLARATERFGRGISDEALPRRGALEIRTIADSFAEMRRRVARFVGDRTTMIAAISHDLRTPLTRMRLRVERVQDEELRAALNRDIDALEAIARETLEFARLDDAPGPPDRVDLASLLQTLADERADTDQDVRCATHAPLVVSARADALRRAIGNLVDNAVAYGACARISVVDLPDAVRIDIDDNGPGIANAQLEEVFRPFVRLEDSRNRTTGGTGLGLAIARNLARAQGGDVVLSNRLHADGTRAGLRASLTLPKGF